jgi:hypothetical protein
VGRNQRRTHFDRYAFEMVECEGWEVKRRIYQSLNERNKKKLFEIST